MPKFNFMAWYDRLSSREKKILQGAIGCVLLLVVDLMVVTPVWESHLALEEKIAVAEEATVRNLINLKRKEAVETAYERYRPFLRTALGAEEENASLLSELEQLARSNQVVLVDIKPRESKTFPFHGEYVAELDAEAEMESLIRFIHQIEGSVQLMRVSSARFASKEAESKLVKATITVTKTAFLGGS